MTRLYSPGVRGAQARARLLLEQARAKHDQKERK